MSDVNGRLAASVPDAPPFTRRHLRFSHPGKLTPGCKAQRRFRCRFSDVAAGSCSFLAWSFHPFESFRRG
ncbi:hypothetical protein [Klebsiella pasteurii]|uniref:hypothetical protein n=1 Tax=Klebsiella pasteurii TaxID=2587529 RepID=UPI002877E8D0|nr:hypothetical protein [Klebsiella pasteurii]WND12969.1 hypothetical protein RIV03_27940 [Klebsiella pasteurii]